MNQTHAIMKKSITYLLLFFASITVNAQVTAGLIEEFKFNSSLSSVSGNSVFVTSEGFAPDRFGNLNSALNKIPSSNCSASIAGLPIGTASRSVSVWFKPNTINADNIIFTYGTASGDAAYGASFSPTNLFNFSYSSNLAHPIVLSTSNWYHLVVTYQTGGAVAMYLNGALVNSGNYPLWNTGNSTTFHLGRLFTGAASFYTGLFDDLKIYNRAITAIEVDTLFQSQPPTQPIMITGNATVCQTSSQTYSISAVSGATSYTWTLPSGWAGTSTSTSINATVGSLSGTISVTANNSFGSSTAQTRAVTVNQTPTQPTSITGSATVCQTSSQTYSISAVSGATSYTWTLPNGWTGTSTTASISATAGSLSGTISVTANNSCGSSTAQTLAVVEVTTGLPSAPVLVSGNLIMCEGVQELFTFSLDESSYSGSVLLTASGSGWIPTADTDSSIIILPNHISGPYTLTATANNSCGSTSSTFSVTSTPVANPSNAAYWEVLPNGLQIDNYETSRFTFQWLLEGQPIQGATGQVHVPTISGNYSLLITPIDLGCPLQPPYTSPSQYVEVDVAVGVNEAATSTMSIYPNPFNTEFVIETTALTTISVMNAMGQVVLSRTINGRTSIDAATLPTGIYFVREETSGAVMKLVKN